MPIDPRIGMTPNDWAEADARRRESLERVSRPHGRPPSRAARLVAGTVFAALLLGLLAYAIAGWIGLLA